MTNRSAITRRLNLNSAETFTLLLLSLSLLLVIGNTAVIGRTVSRSLFLSALPPQFIPFRYIAVTVGVVLATLLSTRIAGRFRRDHFIQWITLVMIGGLLTYRLLLNTPLGSSLWILGSFYVFLEIVQALTVVQFWIFASEIINTRQAKRLFPPITAAGNLGGVLAGAIITVLVPWLGTPNLLYLMSVSLTIYVLLVGILGRGHAAVLKTLEAPSTAVKKAPRRLRQSLRFANSSPLLSMMTVIVVLTTLLVNIVDYQFDLTLVSSFANDTQGLSSFLGSFYFWAGLAGLAVQALISGPMLRRFGISATLLLLPLSILGGSLVVLASGAALLAVTLTRSSDAIFRYTVHDTSCSLLYVPIERHARAQARSVIDGVFKPLTIGLAGLLFLLANRLFGIVVLPWSIVAILIVIILLFVLLRLRPVYLTTLHESIRRHYFDPAGESIDLNNMTTVAVIKATLQQKDESQLLNALTLAQDIPGVDWTDSLLRLLEHESLLVRRQAVRMLRSPESPEYSSLVRRLFDDPDVDVQASAVFTYSVLCREQALDELRPLMHHPLPQVQAAAASGALQYGGPAGEQLAFPIFHDMISNSQSPVRMAAAYALGELHPNLSRQLLCTLLNDPDPYVRLQAVQSAGRLNDSTLLPDVIPQLGDSVVGIAAGEALIRYGVLVFPYLDTYYATAAPDLNVRRIIPVVIARISDLQSALFLLKHLYEPDDLARARVYRALSRLCAAGLFPPTGRPDIEARFMDEIILAYHWAILASCPQLAITGDLLEDALLWRRRYAIDRLLYLVAILYPQANIAQVRASLYGSDLRCSANAIELLDTVLSRTHKELLLPLLEGAPEQILAVAGRSLNFSQPELQPGYANVAGIDDAWLEACVLHSLTRQHLVELAPLVNNSLHSPDLLVRETALLAASELLPQDKYKNALLEHVAEDQLDGLQEYARTCLRLQTETQEGSVVMPIITIERILLLRKVELFKEIPGQELELIARLCSEVHFTPGERFITQGELSDSLYILVDGDVQVSIDGVGVVGVRRGKDVIGEIGVLSNNVRSANCTTITETTALRIDQVDFWDLLKHNASLSVAVIRVLLPRLLEATATNVQARQVAR